MPLGLKAKVVQAILQTLYDRAELGPSDLKGSSWQTGDSVQLVLNPLPLQEHYNIFDPSNVPYRLSVTYMARVVGVEPLTNTLQAPIVSLSLQRGS